jgi:hypothetical protein
MMGTLLAISRKSRYRAEITGYVLVGRFSTVFGCFRFMELLPRAAGRRGRGSVPFFLRLLMMTAVSTDSHHVQKKPEALG